MTTQISSDNIQPATLAALEPVTIASIQVTNSSWTPLDDSAVSTSGGYIVITGANFVSGCNVIINSTNATSVAFVNSTTLRVQVPALSAGTYIVYVSNPNGSTAIIVNGLTYSGTPTWVTVSPLTSGLSGVAISIQLSATGDAPITYAVQAGSTLPAGLTLTSGGLLSGTVSGLSSATTYNFTIEAIDAESQDSPKAFAITILVGDQFWEYVTTLISATTPTTSVFVDDASTNNFAVSVFGDTRPTNFNPYTPGYYSNYFDGTGDYLSIPDNVAFTLGTNNFTFECWVYPTSITAGNNNMLAQWGNGNAWIFRYVAAGRLQFSGAATNVTGTTTAVIANQWNHVAITRSSSTVRLFVNGVLDATTGTIGALTEGASSVTVAAYSDGTSEYVTGYISNLRLVNGTAVYTANFTPPTAPLTAIANTSLLTCQSNRFIDNSTNNFTITVNGDTTVNPFVPFVPSNSYATYGSGYFDGTGDYLTVPNNINLTIGSGDFTIECWVYITGAQTTTYGWSVAGPSTNQGSSGWGLVVNRTSGSRGFGFICQNSFVSNDSTYLPVGQWVHLAVTRSGSGANNLKLFKNGVISSQTTYTTTDTYTASPVYIGADGTGGQAFPGYISSFRFVSGTAVYTAAFTPPTAPLTAIANTSLLTLQNNQPANNSAFLDSSTNNLLITRNGNATQGTVSPYGSSWSNYCAGASSDYLSLTEPAATAGALTVEFWMYPVAQLYSGDGFIVNNSGNGAGSWGFSFNSTNRTIGLWLDSFGSIRFSSNTALTYNTWNHIALVKTSGVIYLYINGVQQSSTYSQAGSFGRATTINIGRYTGTGQPYTGYVSNLRMVYGTALYTTTFTPSTTPLQPITGTVLLTCADNRFIDDSPNNFAITRNGTVNAQKFSPFAGTTLPTPYYSGYFDGTGDYIGSAQNNVTSVMNFASGQDFTMEFWVYSTSGLADYTIANYGTYKEAYNSERVIWITNKSASIFISGGSNTSSVQYTALFPSSATLSTKSWNYIALVRSSNFIKVYVNGVGGTAVSAPGAAQPLSSRYDLAGPNGLWLGVNSTNWTAFTPVGLTGYINNFRYVVGTAVYTANFSPPTAPLTAIAGTVLLTCQNNTFIDNSTYNFAITTAGNTVPSTFAPFAVSYSTDQSYTPAVFGGSMYCDGVSDYLETQNLVVLTPSTNFIAECWVYNFGFSGSQYGRGIFSFFDATANERILVRLDSGSNVVNLYANIAGGQPFGTSGTNSTLTAVPMAWTHVALVRQGSSFRVYLNGVSAITGTSAANFGNLRRIRIGGSSDGSVPDFNGYISDFRYVNGTALYTSQFVPQNIPLTPVQNTVLMVNGTSAGAYDSSMMNNYETVGDAKIDTTVVKFTGTESVRFDGNGDSLTYIGGPSINFGTGDFTIELWVNMANTGTFSSFLRPDGAGDFATFGYDWSNTQLKFDSRNAVILNVTTTAVVANTWTHVAATRSGTSLRLFVNGTQVGATTTNSTNFALTTSPIKIGGSSFSAAHSVNGYISDFRITSGIARYTTTFTPPTNPFPTN